MSWPARAETAVPVAVVVVTWNAADYIEACLGSLRRQSRPPAEVLVIDNASGDGSADRVAGSFPDVRLIRCGDNLGFCRANNLGFEETRAPFVLALNPDTTLEPDFLEALLPAFDDPAVGIATGKLLRFDRQTLDSAGQALGRSRQPIDRGYSRPDDGRYDREERVFGACGAAALYRREMLEQLRDEHGVFDERYFAFYEDLDLAWRAQRHGWQACYRPQAVGYHARGGSGRDVGLAGRLAAMLRRRPEVRYHVVKNRYLTILKNDTLRDYLANLPFIAARDLATLVLLAGTSPSVLWRLWRGRRLFRETVRERRLDSGGARHKTQGRRV